MAGGCFDSNDQSSFYNSDNCKLIRSVIAEFIGTAIFVLCGLASCLNWTHEVDHDQLIRIALTFGFALTSVVYMFGPVSGANLNPVVTVVLMIYSRVQIVAGILYMIAQCLGAITGAWFLYLIQADDFSGQKAHLFGLTKINPDLTVAQGLFSETICTTILVLAVLFFTNESWVDYRSVAGIGLGFVLVVLELGFVNATGGSMNPARSTGPAVIVGDFEQLWVYWVGPLAGGIIAALIYKPLTHQLNALPQEQVQQNNDVALIGTGDNSMLASGAQSGSSIPFDDGVRMPPLLPANQTGGGPIAINLRNDQFGYLNL